MHEIRTVLDATHAHSSYVITMEKRHRHCCTHALQVACHMVGLPGLTERCTDLPFLSSFLFTLCFKLKRICGEVGTTVAAVAVRTTTTLIDLLSSTYLPPTTDSCYGRVREQRFNHREFFILGITCFHPPGDAWRRRVRGYEGGRRYAHEVRRN